MMIDDDDKENPVSTHQPRVQENEKFLNINFHM